MFRGRILQRCWGGSQAQRPDGGQRSWHGVPAVHDFVVAPGWLTSCLSCGAIGRPMDRFMPILPTNFDRVFHDLGIDLVTVRNCSWNNYQRFNAALSDVRRALTEMEGLTKVRLIDAHSFCWILATKLREGVKKKRKGTVRGLSGREKSVIEMRRSVENTVRNAKGQLIQSTLKNKELRMSPAKLEKLLRTLLTLQTNRCALTGIPLHFVGSDAKASLRPSVDRIDSNGQYKHGNLQIVCQFVNFWKADSNNEEFKRLLKLVRSADGVSSQPGMPNPASQRCHDAARADDAVAPGTGAVTMEPRRAAHGQSNRSSVTTLEESMILMSLAAACRRER